MKRVVNGKMVDRLPRKGISDILEGLRAGQRKNKSKMDSLASLRNYFNGSKVRPMLSTLENASRQHSLFC